jgi:hypothetical protein
MSLATLLVDSDSLEFQGANVAHYELCDTCDAQGLPFEAIYISPSDLGSITLLYTETGDTVFHATKAWMGYGRIEYPRTFLEPDTFEIEQGEVPLPADVEYFAGNGQRFTPSEEQIALARGAWDSICKLDLVHAYAEGPLKVGVYRYAPGTGGVGDSFTEGRRWVFFLYRGGR